MKKLLIILILSLIVCNTLYGHEIKPKYEYTQTDSTYSDSIYGAINNFYVRPSKRAKAILPAEYDTVDVKYYVTYRGKPACPNCNEDKWIVSSENRYIIINPPTTDISFLEDWIWGFDNGLYNMMAMCNSCGNLFIYKSYRLVEK